MLLLFIYRGHHYVTFLRFFLAFIFIILSRCARAGLPSPLLIEAGVDDTFPRWNPHSFVLIALSAYAHTHAFHDTLSPEPAHLAGPSAHTRSRPMTVNFAPLIYHFLPLSVAQLNRFLHSFGH